MRSVYSHSSLSNYENCPKSFHYRYVLKIPAEGESIEAYLGKRVHEVLERLYGVVRDGHVPSLEKVLDRFRRIWSESFDPVRIRITRAEDDAGLYHALGERCLTNHYRAHYPFDAEETLALEERVQFTLDAPTGYRIRGVIDRLVRTRDGGIEIHDFKTGRRVPTQRALDQDRQLALYQLGIAARFGDAPVRLVWHYLLHGQQRSSTRSPEQLDSLRRHTVGLIDRIHADTHFEPRPGPLCGWCDYRDRCPASSARSQRAPQHEMLEDVAVPIAAAPAPAPPALQVSPPAARPRPALEQLALF